MRVIYGVLLVVLIAFSGHAQTTFGVKAGANFTDLQAAASGTTTTNFDLKAGFYGGGFLTIPVAENLSIQPELFYSMEGANINTTGRKITLHYINLPLMFQYNYKMFVAEAGPQMSLLLQAKENGYNTTSRFDNVSFALGVGGEYKFQESFGVSARYNLGLTNIEKDAAPQTLKSSVIQVGLRFSLKHKEEN